MNSRRPRGKVQTRTIINLRRAVPRSFKATRQGARDCSRVSERFCRSSIPSYWLESNRLSSSASVGRLRHPGLVSRPLEILSIGNYHIIEHRQIASTPVVSQVLIFFFSCDHYHRYQYIRYVQYPLFLKHGRPLLSVVSLFLHDHMNKSMINWEGG